MTVKSGTSEDSLRSSPKHGCSKLYFLSGKEGQTIISLPESCLLTTDTVIRSYLGAYIAK